MRTITFLTGAIAVGGLSVGCATNQAQPREVDVAENTMRDVSYGNVIGVEQIELDDPSGYEGALIGATLGGLAGVAIGDNTKGRIAGGTIGAIIGGVAGNKVQEEIREDGYEYTVPLDSGRTVAVVELDDRPLARGQRVKLIDNGDTVRILPAG